MQWTPGIASAARVGQLKKRRPYESHLGFGAHPVACCGYALRRKRLDFLFAASVAIRRQVPDFHLLIVGEGAARDKVLAWCSANSWVRWVGGRFGREKVAYMSVAQVMLNPGLVGLGILDAFVCGVPMLTTERNSQPRNLLPGKRRKWHDDSR